MNFTDLIIFKAIYEEKTINQASKKLDYTQSNITARLHAMEDECNTTLFIRSHKGVTPTIHGTNFYSYAVDTLAKFETLKSSFSNNLPKLLTSELLFNYLVIETQQFSIDSTTITCKKTTAINAELNENHYDTVITFNKLNRNDFNLIRSDYIETSFFCTNVEKQHRLPILINSDTSCPLRKLTIELINEPERLLEVDSLENSLQLIAKGKAIALLPCYFAKESYFQTNSDVFNIAYYTYQYTT